MFLIVFLCFIFLFAAVDGLGCVGDGPDVVGNGWDGMGRARVTAVTIFLVFFSGFAIDRSKSI